MHLEESTSDGVPLLALDVATARSIEGSSAGLDLPGTTEVLALRLDRTARQRRVIGLAGPVIGENLLETMLGIIDTVLVAGLGAWAIAGVGSALQVLGFLMAALS